MHSGSSLDAPRDSSACLDIITYGELTRYDTHESQPVLLYGTPESISTERRHRHTRPIRASRAHNSGDTHNAIQYRAKRDAHGRIHTGLTRRRSRQRAQRPANGHPEAPRARIRARESALAHRSRRRLRRPRHSATCGPLARRPGRSACRSRGTWIRGETQRAAPMPTAEGGRRIGGQQWGAGRPRARRR